VQDTSLRKEELPDRAKRIPKQCSKAPPDLDKEPQTRLAMANPMLQFSNKPAKRSAATTEEAIVGKMHGKSSPTTPRNKLQACYLTKSGPSANLVKAKLVSYLIIMHCLYKNFLENKHKLHKTL
jgi:hypothetical protein